MNRTIGFALAFLLFLAGMACRSQSKQSDQLISDFDRTPPIMYGMPEEVNISLDTSPGWNQNGQKILLTGTVYKNDGKTPAENVLLYYYHTDIHGKYSQQPGHPRNMPANQLGQTHGYMRGWIRTDASGNYRIYTVLPGSYPSRSEPAHVHMYIQEPERNEPYYIDDFVFDDDPLLPTEERRSRENRGGSGVIRFVRKDGPLVGERDIILGLHVPEYATDRRSGRISGRQLGEDVFSFTPYHAWGPDRGTTVCPVCKYGWYHGILYFVGNHPDWGQIRQWLVFLEAESKRRDPMLKVYFVYGNEQAYRNDNRMKELEQLGRELQLEQVALTFVPSLSDQRSDIYLNDLDAEAENTFMLYKRSQVIGNFVDLEPSEANFASIRQVLDESINEYFALPKVKH
jgi:protocatechuate 3,4-dioxygenase beta subunit